MIMPAEKMVISRVDGASSTAWFVGTAAVNWVVLQDDSGVTLIDGGYPRQAALVEESITKVGASPSDIRGALLTHAHVDHIGGLVSLAARHGFPVFADPDEVGHARRDYLQQASPAAIASVAHRPRVWRWLAEVVPLGVLSRKGIGTTQPFAHTSDLPRPLDLPGAPVPVASHGHTDGHSAYLVADGAVLVSGDALVSDHPISGVSGCQCIPDVFQHDVAAARRSVEAFTTLDATVLFPGHGPRVDGSVAEMAREALAR
ncbi:MBL fold metallo-hydrolase [Gordonia sp. N1V]|uniref:MBL fold metallo-hydrolase n=1 Tax=Gordonia sp. N1V TaxID=3034163 RepID=UPI0023E25E7E|nr:MBL fold metallo-hydrolase [Gordonia sp. N1V]MDF3285432.1 MBL fold metallo-hydrolase [Gordonia sp. N1V]